APAARVCWRPSEWTSPHAAPSCTTPTGPRACPESSPPVTAPEVSASSCGRSRRAAAAPRRWMRTSPGPRRCPAPAAPARTPSQCDRLGRRDAMPRPSCGARAVPEGTRPSHELQMGYMRKAKIVCTLSPATGTYEQIRTLVEAGMNVARMNFSHGTHDDHAQVYANIRRAAEDLGKNVAVL